MHLQISLQLSNHDQYFQNYANTIAVSLPNINLRPLCVATFTIFTMTRSNSALNSKVSAADMDIKLLCSEKYFFAWNPLTERREKVIRQNMQ